MLSKWLVVGIYIELQEVTQNSLRWEALNNLFKLKNMLFKYSAITLLSLN